MAAFAKSWRQEFWPASRRWLALPEPRPVLLEVNDKTWQRVGRVLRAEGWKLPFSKQSTIVMPIGFTRTGVTG
jgi:hypothetical protein